MKHCDRAALVFTCLGFGGLGMAIIMCLLIGFGFHTTVGKEALYTAFVLQALNLAVARWREIRFLKGRAAPTPSKKMRRLRLVATWLWCAGAVFLVASLGLAVCGMHFGNFGSNCPAPSAQSSPRSAGWDCSSASAAADKPLSIPIPARNPESSNPRRAFKPPAGFCSFLSTVVLSLRRNTLIYRFNPLKI